MIIVHYEFLQRGRLAAFPVFSKVLAEQLMFKILVLESRE